MTAIQYKPAHFHHRFRSNLNPWLERWAQLNEEGETSISRWEPQTNIVEKDDNYLVSVELPGVSKDDVKITMVDNALTIKGEKNQIDKVDEKNYYRIERNFGAFQRTFRLKEQVDINKIHATFKDGILTIDLVKKEEVKPKEITIGVE